MAFAGPLANIATGLVLAATFLGAGGNMNLLGQPLIASASLLRSMVWMQIFIGVLHPAPRLSAGLRPPAPRQLRPQARFAPALAPLPAWAKSWPSPPWSAAVVCTIPGLIIAGFFIMIGAQIEDQGVFFQDRRRYGPDARGHAHRLRHPLTFRHPGRRPSTAASTPCRRDFPVVRGPQLVGIVSRQRIVDALRSDGNGYVQSVMSRAFQVARPEDTLGTTIRRITAGRGPLPDSHHRKRTRRRRGQRAKLDERHVSACRAAPHRASGIRDLAL